MRVVNLSETPREMVVNNVNLKGNNIGRLEGKDVKKSVKPRSGLISLKDPYGPLRMTKIQGSYFNKSRKTFCYPEASKKAKN